MLGDNAGADIRGRAKELASVLDDIAALQERAKAIKSEARLDGYDMKAFSQIVREMRRGPDYQCAQLELELVLQSYRRGVGLPVTLEEAQRLAREAAGDMPSVEDTARKAQARRSKN